MEKIIKEFKNFYELEIKEDKIKVSYYLGGGRYEKWETTGIFTADFKIQAKRFGDDAGILKIEIG